MKKFKVYVAGPYSGGDVMTNISSAIGIGDSLMSLGFTPYIPHLTGFWHLRYPKPHRTWLNYDFEWLEVCDAVYRIRGESPGADEEVAYARKLGIPVFDTMMELNQWKNEEKEKCETS